MINWPTAFCLTFGILFFLAFLLFLIVYLKELARENKILKDYKQGLATMPLVFVDQPAPKPKKAPQPKEPEPKDPKKNYN